MFDIPITYTPFMDHKGFSVFGRITQTGTCGPDRTMLSTIRALLFKRTTESFVVVEDYSTFSVNEHTMKVSLMSDSDYNACEGRVSGIPLKAINDFLGSQKIKIKCFTNEKGNGGLIAICGESLRLRHLAQFFIPRIIPAYFENAPITEKEKNLLFSVKEKTQDKYMEAIQAIADELDLEAVFIKSSLHNFSRSRFETRLQYLKNEIEDINSSIESYRDSIRGLITNRQHMIDESNSIDLKINSNDATGDDDLIRFFLSNRNVIDVLGVDGGCVSFMVRTILQSWNEDEMYRVITNGQALRVPVNNSFWSQERVAKFVKAVFLPNPKLKIRMIGYYTLDTNYNEVTTQRGFDRNGKYADYARNPHLYKHGCLGDHEMYINEAMEAGEMETAIMQCVESAKSVNPSEMDVTFRPFLKSVFEDGNKIILLPDGTNVTPVQAMVWLEEQEKEETNNEAN